MKRSWAILLLCLLAACRARSQPGEVRIGVLGLFHPKEIIVSAADGRPLECFAGEERWAVGEPMRVRLAGGVLRVLNPAEAKVTAFSCGDGPGGATEFTVAIPGKISRRYRGRLELQAQAAELLITVEMDLEVAVASIVAAESPPHSRIEALKAQAVATRSFLVAGKGRHSNFDFCDTTHCQFLRDPPRQGSSAMEAAVATRGLVLAYKGQAFAAMYSASCGGRTHSLEDLGIAARSYPYFSVICDYCHRHPEKWVARISEKDAAGLSPTENSRLKLARKLGWKTVPGNSYSSRTEDGDVILEGSGVGHGIGLCQRGGADMARKGASFQQILEHYYPNTELRQY
jgi:stage II sporulation protein D (peptidoglycan lytic transglycosylase)